MDGKHRSSLKVALLGCGLVAVTACVGPAAVVAAPASSASVASVSGPGVAGSGVAGSGVSGFGVQPTPRNTTVWMWPLGTPGEVSRGFQAPATRYSAGHRGIDFPATPSAPVYAPGDGVVSFAGLVAGRPVLAIAHAGDLITSFEPVLTDLSEGDRVARGQVIGSIATGGHCGESCLHFGVRLHGEYVSPLLYLAGVPRAVLLPLLSPPGR